MELARIVAMAMIVFRHFVFHGMWGCWPGPVASYGPLNGSEYILCFLCFLFDAGMDLFILLSGYYGIKLRWKGIISFWLISIFYGALCLLVNGVEGPMDIVNVFIISRSRHWFVRSYFLLMLFSPILNAALDSLDIKNLRLSALLMFVVCCVSGWAFNNGTSNAMNVLQLICVYFIGGWIKRDNLSQAVKMNQAIIGYVLCAVLNFLGMIVIYYVLKKEIGIMYQNNNPLTLISACLLFFVFRDIEFKSKFVNVWASTMFGVLLLSDMVFYNRLYHIIHSCFLCGGGKGLISIWSLYAAVFAIGFAVEYIRKLVAEPITNKLSKFISSLSNGNIDQA